MWEGFKQIIFNCIEFFYNLCGDWGLAIIIITVIFRACLIPLMHKQTKSSFDMQKMQPKMNRIKELYADDKLKQSEEMRKIQAEAGVNPIAGCVPMLIQIPIFTALFQVLRSMGDNVDSAEFHFFNIIPNLVNSPAQAWEQGFVAFLPYLVLIIIFAGATFLPMMLQQQAQDPKQAKTMKIMAIAMSVMMIFVGWSSPAGVLLFWGTSSLLALAQQQISRRILKRQDQQKEEEEEYEPVVVDVVRKEKSKRPKKKK